MKRARVKSSHLQSVGYTGTTLEVQFQSGPVYQYPGVPERVVKGLLNATSKGNYFAEHIRDRYHAKKVS